MDPNFIKETVYNLRQNSELGENILRHKYLSFAEDYPRLFEFAIDKSIKLEFLDLMLDQLKLINENCISLDTADSNVYKILQDKYIPPSCNTIPNMSNMPSTQTD